MSLMQASRISLKYIIKWLKIMTTPSIGNHMHYLLTLKVTFIIYLQWHISHKTKCCELYNVCIHDPCKKYYTSFVQEHYCKFARHPNLVLRTRFENCRRSIAKQQFPHLTRKLLLRFTQKHQTNSVALISLYCGIIFVYYVIHYCI